MFYANFIFFHRPLTFNTRLFIISEGKSNLWKARMSFVIIFVYGNKATVKLRNYNEALKIVLL